MYFNTQLYMYLVNEPQGGGIEYGGLSIVAARTDEECVYLIQRRHSEYSDVSFDDATPEIIEHVRNHYSSYYIGSNDEIARCVEYAHRHPIAEQRFNVREGGEDLNTLVEFLEEYGDRTKWDEAEQYYNEPRIMKSFVA